MSNAYLGIRPEIDYDTLIEDWFYCSESTELTLEFVWPDGHEDDSSYIYYLQSEDADRIITAMGVVL